MAGKGEVVDPHRAQVLFSGHQEASREPSVNLSPEQVEKFRREGWIDLPLLAPKEEIDALRAKYDEFFAEGKGREDGNFFDLVTEDAEEGLAPKGDRIGRGMVTPQMLWPSKYGYDLFGTQLYANALHVSRQLLGDSTKFKGDHAILKPGQAEGAGGKSVPTPWHQDEAYWSDGELEFEALGVWLALQDVSEDMGCMTFLDNTATPLSKDVVEHESVGGDCRVHGLEVVDKEPLPLQAAQPCPLPAGGATLHHCRTFHYTGPNQTPKDRRAYTLCFQSVQRHRELPQSWEWNKKKQTNRQKRAEDAGWEMTP